MHTVFNRCKDRMQILMQTDGDGADTLTGPQAGEQRSGIAQPTPGSVLQLLGTLPGALALTLHAFVVLADFDRAAIV